MAAINERADDLVMESTTDSAEQIADGLGVELAPVDPNAEPKPETPPESVPDGTGDAGSEPAPPKAEPPAGQVSVEAEKVGAPRKGTKRRVADTAAVREATAAAEVLRRENETLKQRLAEASAVPASGAPGLPPVVPPPVAAPASAVALKPGDIPADHPALQDIASRRAVLGAKPSQDTYDDYEKYVEDKDTWLRNQGALDAEENLERRELVRQQRAQQAQAQQDAQATLQTFQQRREAAKARHPDFEKVMDAAQAQSVGVQSHIGDAIIESEAGGELVYHFAKNPKELERIQALPRLTAIMEVGVLARQLAPGGTAAPSRPARITRAPEPQGTVLGELPSGGHEADLDDPNISQAQYNRLRDRMDQQSGRRPH